MFAANPWLVVLSKPVSSKLLHCCLSLKVIFTAVSPLKLSSLLLSGVVFTEQQRRISLFSVTGVKHYSLDYLWLPPVSFLVCILVCVHWQNLWSLTPAWICGLSLLSQLVFINLYVRVFPFFQILLHLFISGMSLACLMWPLDCYFSHPQGPLNLYVSSCFHEVWPIHK